MNFAEAVLRKLVSGSSYTNLCSISDAALYTSSMFIVSKTRLGDSTKQKVKTESQNKGSRILVGTIHGEYYTVKGKAQAESTKIRDLQATCSKQNTLPLCYIFTILPLLRNQNMYRIHLNTNVQAPDINGNAYVLYESRINFVSSFNTDIIPSFTGFSDCCIKINTQSMIPTAHSSMIWYGAVIGRVHRSEIHHAESSMAWCNSYKKPPDHDMEMERKRAWWQITPRCEKPVSTTKAGQRAFHHRIDIHTCDHYVMHKVFATIQIREVSRFEKILTWVEHHHNDRQSERKQASQAKRRP